MIALLAGLGLFFKQCRTRVTGPLHSDPRLTVLPLHRRIQIRWRLRIAGVSVRVFVEFRRMSRAQFAPHMLTAGTCLLPTDINTLAQMTGPPHYLPGFSAHQLFSILLYDEWLRLGFRLFGQFHILSLPAGVIHSGGSRRRLFRLRILLLLLERIAGALLAACMITVRAHLVRAKCRLTAMTMAMDSHPNRLLNPFGKPRDWRLPFVGFELESVLFKQSLSLFLLGDARLRKALLQVTNLKSTSSAGACSLRFGILGLLDRITWTALTAGMTAV